MTINKNEYYYADLANKQYYHKFRDLDDIIKAAKYEGLKAIVIVIKGYPYEFILREFTTNGSVIDGISLEIDGKEGSRRLVISEISAIRFCDTMYSTEVIWEIDKIIHLIKKAAKQQNFVEIEIMNKDGKIVKHNLYKLPLSTSLENLSKHQSIRATTNLFPWTISCSINSIISLRIESKRYLSQEFLTGITSREELVEYSEEEKISTLWKEKYKKEISKITEKEILQLINKEFQNLFTPDRNKNPVCKSDIYRSLCLLNGQITKLKNSVKKRKIMFLILDNAHKANNIDKYFDYRYFFEQIQKENKLFASIYIKGGRDYLISNNYSKLRKYKF